MLMVAVLLPNHEPWRTLNPFAWTYGQQFGWSQAVIERSKLLYAALGLALLLAHWPLPRRPERLLRA